GSSGQGSLTEGLLAGCTDLRYVLAMIHLATVGAQPRVPFEGNQHVALPTMPACDLDAFDLQLFSRLWIGLGQLLDGSALDVDRVGNSLHAFLQDPGCRLRVRSDWNREGQVVALGHQLAAIDADAFDVAPGHAHDIAGFLQGNTRIAHTHWHSGQVTRPER